jgi:hypothetical protein
LFSFVPYWSEAGLSGFRRTEFGFIRFFDDRSKGCIAATHIAGLLSAL